MGELGRIALDMASVADTADGEGLPIEEYDEYGLPESHRRRTQFAMDRWANGACDLRQAAAEMAQIAREIEGDPDV